MTLVFYISTDVSLSNRKKEQGYDLAMTNLEGQNDTKKPLMMLEKTSIKSLNVFLAWWKEWNKI